jgi:hypothetical protein
VRSPAAPERRIGPSSWAISSCHGSPSSGRTRSALGRWRRRRIAVGMSLPGRARGSSATMTLARPARRRAARWPARAHLARPARPARWKCARASCDAPSGLELRAVHTVGPERLQDGDPAVKPVWMEGERHPKRRVHASAHAPRGHVCERAPAPIRRGASRRSGQAPVVRWTCEQRVCEQLKLAAPASSHIIASTGQAQTRLNPVGPSPST